MFHHLDECVPQEDMNWIRTLIYFIAIRTLPLTISQDDDNDIVFLDKSDWVDPGDMLNYDIHTKTMKNKGKQVV